MNNLAVERRRPQARKPITSSANRRREFAEAVERVYRKYGTNLDEFIRDIQKQKELIKKG
jgi:hypothetical protein